MITTEDLGELEEKFQVGSNIDYSNSNKRTSKTSYNENKKLSLVKLVLRSTGRIDKSIKTQILNFQFVQFNQKNNRRDNGKIIKIKLYCQTN